MGDHATTGTTGPAPDADVLETELGTELCLLNRRTDEVLVLNTTAADLWRLLDGATPVEAAVDVLAATYRVPPDEVGSQVAPLVEDLRAKGFLTAPSTS